MQQKWVSGKAKKCLKDKLKGKKTKTNRSSQEMKSAVITVKITFKKMEYKHEKRQVGRRKTGYKAEKDNRSTPAINTVVKD